MPALEHLFEDVTHARRLHPEFRLIFTSFPIAEFPSNVLQASVKLTTESSVSMAASLKVRVVCLQAPVGVTRCFYEPFC